MPTARVYAAKGNPGGGYKQVWWTNSSLGA